MRYVNVNYNLNKTYKVEDKAIEQLIRGVVREMKSVKLIDVVIDVANTFNSYKISLTVSKQETVGFAPVAEALQNRINERTESLVSYKPDNIMIIFGEEE